MERKVRDYLLLRGARLLILALLLGGFIFDVTARPGPVWTFASSGVLVAGIFVLNSLVRRQAGILLEGREPRFKASGKGWAAFGGPDLLGRCIGFSIATALGIVIAILIPEFRVYSFVFVAVAVALLVRSLLQIRKRRKVEPNRSTIDDVDTR